MSFTKAQLIGLINTNLANASNITAAELRQVLLDTLDATITGENSDTQKSFQVGNYVVSANLTTIRFARLYPITLISDLIVVINDTDGISIIKNDPSGTLISRIRMDNDGKIFVEGLPTSDPSNTGQMYVDSGTLKISL
jgi:hypothetical protein